MNEGTTFIYGTYVKHVKNCPNGCVFIFREYDTNRAYKVVGNVPKIENRLEAKRKTGKKKGTLQDVSMSIGLRLDKDGNVIEYTLKDSDRNRKRLATLGYEADDFFEDVRFHQKSKCKWRDVKKMRNPYNHFDFHSADAFFHNIGGYYESDIRLAEMNKQIIENFRSNNKSAYTLEEYLDAFRDVESTGVFAPVSHKAIMKYFTTHYDFSFDGVYVRDREIEEAEKYIKYRFTKCGHSLVPFIPEDVIERVLDKHPELSDEQKDCVRALKNDSIEIITGGAGTGKTTIIKAIIETYREFFSGEPLLLAPTGKASRRIAIKCDESAFTMHHALNKSLDNDYIRYNQAHPFENNLFVVDESSMIDTLLMRDLLRAIEMGSKVIFVGDANQLEAVGVGSPFHEMVENGLCTVLTLTKNFRQSDDNVILENAEAVLNGELFHEGKGVSIYDIDLKDINKYIDENTVNISPYCRIVELINRCVYQRHKDEDKFQDGFYYKGCSVVFTHNTDKYCNGDTGRIIRFDEESIDIMLDDVNKLITVKYEDLENMKFAYALTTHKVQGSEYEKIKIFLPKKLTNFSANKNMLYTMITRARKNVEIYYYSE